MSDYIKRTDAAEAVWCILNGMGYSQKHNDRLVEEVDAVLDEYSAADVRPVVKAHWIPTGETEEIYGDVYRCSACGCCDIGEIDYCPNCGAMMEES